jgi:hypothetical protein
MERNEVLARLWTSGWWNAEIRLSLPIALLATLVIIAGGIGWYSYTNPAMNTGFVPVRDITTGLGTRPMEPPASFDSRFFYVIPTTSDSDR